MRLVNMDVDHHGKNERCRLGRLSAGLNAICGPRGTGKTTLLHWLRLVVEQCTGPADSAPRSTWDQWKSPASGTVEIQNKSFDFRVTTDRNGRIHFDPLNDQPLAPNQYSLGYRDPVLSVVQRQAFAGLAAASGALDTTSALEQLARQLGLVDHLVADDRRSRLQARERELHLLLEREQQLESRDFLLARQQQLELELADVGRQGSAVRARGYEVERRRIDERSAVIDADLRATLLRIEELDRAIAEKTSELSSLDGGHDLVDVGQSYRRQLREMDDRLDRWRQTLRDLKSHRETVEHNATDARLDRQIGDQLSSTKDSDPRAAMRSLEAQILNTRQQLDLLVERYTAVPGYDYRSAAAAMSHQGYARTNGRSPHSVYHDPSGRTYIGSEQYLPESSLLPETLRSMQKDLQEVCQQLARYESKTATETLRQQALQLKRCEEELLQSVEKLIEERAVLLRTIANEQHISVEQLTLAFGNWCQCHDHPHLREWLLDTDKADQANARGESPDRQELIHEVEMLKRERKQAGLRADDCRRQLRDVNAQRSLDGAIRQPANASRSAAEIRRDLDQVLADLARIESRDQVGRELDDVRRQLRGLPAELMPVTRYRESVDRHIAALMPTRQMPPQYATSQRLPRQATTRRDSEGVAEQRYDLVDGIATESRDEYSNWVSKREVPTTVVRLAMRLAIAEALKQRGEPVSLVLDEALDDLPIDVQRSVVAHLAVVADRGQQIVVLTSDERVAELIRLQRGVVCYMQTTPKAKQDIDVNRHLSALANDQEAEKWNQPLVHPRVPTSQELRPAGGYYLNERSLVEELPSIEPAAAARCRALGVDRIGDLLDVDPYWLAENLRMDGPLHSQVIGWQAEARLLCSVRNLRPFDARVLVGVGVRTPGQLADMHPSELLDRVEHFLSTEEGRRILRSGNSYELSRITAWIASAEGGASRYDRSSFTNQRHSGRARTGAAQRPAKGESERSSRESAHEQRSSQPRRDVSDNDRYDESSRSSRRSAPTSSSWSRSSAGSTRSARESGEAAGRGRRSTRRARNARRGSRAYPVIDRDGSRSGKWESQAATKRPLSEPVPFPEPNAGKMKSAVGLKFYLELSSPIVDAPSIGPRAGAKLEQHGIYSVGDLLAANAESLANKLNHPRATAETIREWQEQARLVCRIPNLRGHDAQLLVACDFTSPEELAEMTPEAVLAPILKVARSKLGQRILRGGQEPDLAEVTDWITWAASCRSLSAA